MLNSATIKLFLPYGDPSKLRTAEISNWSGKAIAAPRTELNQLCQREEASKPGIYFLLGMDTNDGSALAYIGEAENVASRLKQQLSKEFWHTVIIFVSKDENLTKSHIRYLEGRLISTANDIKRCKIENFQSSGAKLPEADLHEMEVFLSRVTQLLPILGSDLLTPITRIDNTEQSAEIYTYTRKGTIATGKRSPTGFVVFAGSIASFEIRQSAEKHGQWVLALRDKLISNETLKQDGPNLVFTRDSEFASPSAAAAVIAGGNVAGPIAWKNKDGKTLKEIEQQI